MSFFGRKARPLRLSLSEDDFYALVRGEIVEKENVQICLQDIGYTRMILLIEKARYIGDSLNFTPPREGP